jgi:NAD(P)H-flavin reductase
LLSLEESKIKSPQSESILTARESGDIDIEKKEPVSTSSSIYPSITIYRGRPDIAAFITDVASKADRYDRIAVAACGPDSMIQVARKSVAKNITVDGPSLEFHCEQFGW